MDNEGFNLLRAAPITAGVQAEARQQIAGPDSPVISAYNELFSDVKWSSGLQEQFGNKKKHSSNSKEKQKQGCWEEESDSHNEMPLCSWGRTTASGPRAPQQALFPIGGK